MPKSIEFKMVVSEEMITKWCALKGFGNQSPMPPMQGQLQQEAESELAFFERMVKQELLTICIQPLQNAIYQFSSMKTQEEIDNLKAAAESAMSVSISDIAE